MVSPTSGKGIISPRDSKEFVGPLAQCMFGAVVARTAKAPRNGFGVRVERGASSVDCSPHLSTQIALMRLDTPLLNAITASCYFATSGIILLDLPGTLCRLENCYRVPQILYLPGSKLPHAVCL